MLKFSPTRFHTVWFGNDISFILDDCLFLYEVL